MTVAAYTLDTPNLHKMWTTTHPYFMLALTLTHTNTSTSARTYQSSRAVVFSRLHRPSAAASSLHLTLNLALFRTTGQEKLRGMLKCQSRCDATCTPCQKTWLATGTPHYPSASPSTPYLTTLHSALPCIPLSISLYPSTGTLHTPLP